MMKRVEGKIGGYLSRERAIEVVIDEPIPAWVSGNVNARVTLSLAADRAEEQDLAARDLVLTGTAFMRDGKRIDPATVLIDRAEAGELPALHPAQKALRKIRAAANHPGCAATHGNAYVDGMRCAANMLEAVLSRRSSARAASCGGGEAVAVTDVNGEVHWLRMRIPGATLYTTPPPAPAAVAGGEADEDAYVIDALAHLLAEISIIVNGPEPAGTKWSYHDLPAKVRALAAQPAAGEEWPRELVEWLESRNLLPDGPFDGNDLVAVLNDHEAALAAAQRPGAGDVDEAMVERARWLLDCAEWKVHPDSMSHDEAGSLYVWAQDAAGLLAKVAALSQPASGESQP